GCLARQGCAATRRLLLWHLQFAQPNRLLHSELATWALCHCPAEDQRQGSDHPNSDSAGNGGCMEAGWILSATELGCRRRRAVVSHQGTRIQGQRTITQRLVLLSDGMGLDGAGELHEHAAARQNCRRNAALPPK